MTSRVCARNSLPQRMPGGNHSQGTRLASTVAAGPLALEVGSVPVSRLCQTRLSDLVCVPADLWQDTCAQPPGSTSEAERDLAALEVGHVGMVTRHREAARGSHSARRGGGSCTDPRRRTRLLVVPSPRTRLRFFPRGVSAGPRLKVSVLLDPALDSQTTTLARKIAGWTNWF